MTKLTQAALCLLLATPSLIGCQARPPFQPSQGTGAEGPSEAGYGLLQSPEGAKAVQSALIDTLKDPKRQQRPLPLKVYFPAGLRGACPVVIVSHGGQGHENSREAYAYLGQHLASQGFVAIHPQHRQDDRRPLTYDRPMDVRFLLDQLEAQKVRIPGFVGRLDLKAVGMAGHSFGAYTTLALAGMKVDLPWPLGGQDTRFTDRRLKAFLALSPSGADQFGVDAKAWSGIQAPVYEMVGEAELSVKGDGSPARPNWRLESWQALPPGDKHLAILPGAQHSDFNDRREATATTERTHAFVQANATLFFQAHLLGQKQLKPLIGRLAQPAGTTTARK